MGGWLIMMMRCREWKKGGEGFKRDCFLGGEALAA